MSSLIAELVSAAAAEKGIIFEEAMEDRLCAYSRAVAHFPTAVKEVKLQFQNMEIFYEGYLLSLFYSYSSSGGMDGSTQSLRRQLQMGNQIHAPCIQHGSKS